MAASNSMASNSSRLRTATSAMYPSARKYQRSDQPRWLSSGGFQRVPETTAQRMADLVLEQRVDRQDRALQQPSLEVRRHPRLAGEDSFEPQPGGVPAHRFAEVEALVVGRPDGVRKRDRHWLSGTNRGSSAGCTWAALGAGPALNSRRALSARAAGHGRQLPGVVRLALAGLLLVGLLL